MSNAIGWRGKVNLSLTRVHFRSHSSIILLFVQILCHHENTRSAAMHRQFAGEQSRRCVTDWK
jgi:hypothetical protein